MTETISNIHVTPSYIVEGYSHWPCFAFKNENNNVIDCWSTLNDNCMHRLNAFLLFCVIDKRKVITRLILNIWK